MRIKDVYEMKVSGRHGEALRYYMLSSFAKTLSRQVTCLKFFEKKKSPTELIYDDIMKFITNNEYIVPLSVMLSDSVNVDRVRTISGMYRASLMNYSLVNQEAEEVDFSDLPIVQFLLSTKEFHGMVSKVSTTKSSLAHIVDGVLRSYLESEIRAFIPSYVRRDKKDKVTDVRTIVKEVPVEVPVEVYDDDLFEELVSAKERIIVLEDKLSLIGKTVTTTVKEDEVPVIESIDIDLSDYKLLMIGSKDGAESYPCEYVDINVNYDRLDRIANMDYVLFDTRVCSHQLYWAVKSRCKSFGTPLLHINCRNKDRIVQEIKRAIAHKEGKL